ncbi:MAG: arginine repressor [Clostridia bacterium]|nr:arginine repressor [Clostridia bacterium]
MKVKRHNKIMEIIGSCHIETQEELIDKLRDAGFDVTQATISRDIRELKLAKVMCETGSYKYVLPKSGENDSRHVYSKALSGSIKSVDCALNDIVIKTYPGLANAVAAAIDSLHEHDILGCVAGDDTIILIAHSAESALNLCKRLRKIANE